METKLFVFALGAKACSLWGWGEDTLLSLRTWWHWLTFGLGCFGLAVCVLNIFTCWITTLEAHLQSDDKQSTGRPFVLLYFQSAVPSFSTSVSIILTWFSWSCIYMDGWQKEVVKYKSVIKCVLWTICHVLF